jgi:hypothetical protein
MVGWIGENFLVSAHACIEHHFAKRFARRAKRFSREHGSVFENKIPFQLQPLISGMSRMAGPTDKKKDTPGMPADIFVFLLMRIQN